MVQLTRKATEAIPYTELEVAGPYDPSTNTGNFDTQRATVDRIIIHTMDGTWQGAAARFDDPKSEVSAHYGIKYDGSLIHCLEEFNTAYHAGDLAMNRRSIGIEHEDLGNYNSPRPDVVYTTSAKLVADICKFYSIPIDRKHILKHSEVSDLPTGCPDALDIDRIVRQALLVTPGNDLVQCNTERNDNWNIVIAVGKQLNISPNPNDKPGTTKKYIAVIQALQDSVKITATPGTGSPATDLMNLANSQNPNDKQKLVNFLTTIGKALQIVK